MASQLSTAVASTFPATSERSVTTSRERASGCAAFDLPDPGAAAQSFEHLVAAARVAIEAGRFGVENDPADIALRFWASGHGIVSLTVTGVLPVAELRRHAPAVACALFIDAGDSPDRARRSVRSAWRGTGGGVAS